MAERSSSPISGGPQWPDPTHPVVGAEATTTPQVVKAHSFGGFVSPTSSPSLGRKSSAPDTMETGRRRSSLSGLFRRRGSSSGGTSPSSSRRGSLPSIQDELDHRCLRVVHDVRSLSESSAECLPMLLKCDDRPEVSADDLPGLSKEHSVKKDAKAAPKTTPDQAIEAWKRIFPVIHAARSLTYEETTEAFFGKIRKAICSRIDPFAEDSPTVMLLLFQRLLTRYDVSQQKDPNTLFRYGWSSNDLAREMVLSCPQGKEFISAVVGKIQGITQSLCSSCQEECPENTLCERFVEQLDSELLQKWPKAPPLIDRLLDIRREEVCRQFGPCCGSVQASSWLWLRVLSPQIMRQVADVPTARKIVRIAKLLNSLASCAPPDSKGDPDLHLGYVRLRHSFYQTRLEGVGRTTSLLKTAHRANPHAHAYTISRLFCDGTLVGKDWLPILRQLDQDECPDTNLQLILDTLVKILKDTQQSRTDQPLWKPINLKIFVKEINLALMKNGRKLVIIESGEEYKVVKQEDEAALSASFSALQLSDP